MLPPPAQSNIKKREQAKATLRPSKLEVSGNSPMSGRFSEITLLFQASATLTCLGPNHPLGTFTL